MIRLAIAYLSSQWKLVMTLVVIIGLSLALPITSIKVVARYQSELKSRSLNPPLLVGARGDRFDLVLRSQFFVGELQQALTYREFARLKRNDELVCAPLHLVHSAGQGQWPIVGTSSVYFNAQRLGIDQGHLFTEIGQCVVGADVAEYLQSISVIKSDMSSVFGFGDMLPYELQVSGVLERRGTPDDRAVFVSLETAWLLDGYGHAHRDGDNGTAVNRNSVLHGLEGAHIPQYSETDLSVIDKHLIHFHGDRSDYRISSVAVWPTTQEANALLRVGYQDDRTTQVVVPGDEFEKLMEQVVRVKDILDLVFAILLCISAVMVLVTIVQSFQLRKTDLETMRYLGCSLSKVRLLLLTEFSLVAGLAVVACLVFVILLESAAPALLSIV